MRLAQGALGQLLAADALGKPEVVLDARTGAGLATGCLALDDDGAQSFGGGVDGGGEPGRPGAQDRHVVLGLRWLDVEAEPLGELEPRGRIKPSSVGEQD